MSIYSNGLKINGEIYDIVPPSPSNEVRGGIKASSKEDTYTVEVKVGSDDKLYVPTYPTLDEIEEITSEEIQSLFA